MCVVVTFVQNHFIYLFFFFYQFISRRFKVGLSLEKKNIKVNCKK